MEQLDGLFGAIAKMNVPQRCKGGCGCTVVGPIWCDPCAARRMAEDRDESYSVALESIPSRFRWARRESEALIHRVNGSSDQICRVLDVVDTGRSVLLQGHSGAGKTSLACAAMRSVIDAGKGPQVTTKARLRAGMCRLVSASALARARAEWPLGRGEAPFLLSALKASLLVIDELGSETGDPGVICEVLYERHNENRQTIVTTWLDAGDPYLPEIARRYGDGIARRLAEGLVVRLDRRAAAA